MQQGATVPLRAKHDKDACSERLAASGDAPPKAMIEAARERSVEENNLRNMVELNNPSLAQIMLMSSS